MLTNEEKRYLLERSRAVLIATVRGEDPGRQGDVPVRLNEPSGAFVTLHVHGELRGCIGYLDAVAPLIHTVSDVTAKAALEDPRFMPVTPEELGDISIEISVISPMQPVSSIDDVVIGIHGLMISKGTRRGVLLPQVPTEYGWDRETFAAQTCRKAGLPHDAWKLPDTKIFTFTAEVFHEDATDKGHNTE